MKPGAPAAHAMVPTSQPLATTVGPRLLEDGMVVNFQTLHLGLGWGLLQLDDPHVVGGGAPERVQTLPLQPCACPVMP